MVKHYTIIYAYFNIYNEMSIHPKHTISRNMGQMEYLYTHFTELHPLVNYPKMGISKKIPISDQ